jgi:hypothetical protein
MRRSFSLAPRRRDSRRPRTFCLSPARSRTFLLGRLLDSRRLSDNRGTASSNSVISPTNSPLLKASAKPRKLVSPYLSYRTSNSIRSCRCFLFIKARVSQQTHCRMLPLGSIQYSEHMSFEISELLLWRPLGKIENMEFRSGKCAIRRCQLRPIPHFSIDSLLENNLNKH